MCFLSIKAMEQAHNYYFMRHTKLPFPNASKHVSFIQAL